MPRANSVPSKSQIITTSPFAKVPSQRFTPGGNRLLPFSRKAVFAPSSTISAPLGLWKNAIHRLRPRNFAGRGTKRVPTSRPSITSARAVGLRPEAMTIGMPERMAICAASIFVAMPPTAVLLVVPRA